MVFPLVGAAIGAGAAGAGGGIGLSSLASLLPLAGGLFGGGGGDVSVSQTASNTTSVNLSTILSNQSPGNASAPASGGASAFPSSGTGTAAPPLQTSPFDVPYSGYGSTLADAAATATPASFNKNTVIGISLIAGLGLAVAAAFSGGKRKGG